VTDGPEILLAGLLMAAALGASLLAGRLRIPGLLLFLAVGMIAGSDVLGWVELDDYELARDVGIIALILILVEGGLTSGLDRLRPVLGAAIGLATVGTLLTAVVTGLGAALLFDFTLLESMLLGSIVASTDAAAVFGVLRGSTLQRRLARTLEGESGMNDPIAILLVLGFIEWIQLPDYGAVQMVGELALKLVLGFAIGIVAGWIAVQGFKRLRLDTAGLYPVVSVSAAAIAYGAGETLGGSGFLAVYLVALSLGSADVPAKRTITAFHEGMGWTGQLVLFLTLGLLVFPTQLPNYALEGLALGLVLAFIARPIAVFATTAPFRFDLAERTVLSWAGLRGAIPVVLATFAVTAGVEGSLAFFNIVFFSVVISTLLQGATFEWVADRLGVTGSEPAQPRPLLEVGTVRRLGAEVVEYHVDPDDAIAGARVRDLGLPRDALVSVIVRGGRALAPRGSMRIEGDDRLHVLVLREASGPMRELLERWRTGPVGPETRPKPLLAGRPPIFTVRPWRSDDGDPARPDEIEGQPVIELLRRRLDHPGTLVVLADGRYALTGNELMVGSARQLQNHVLGLLPRASDDATRAWWQEITGALAAEHTLKPD
jgi:potassium/hydrogen antiporter